MTVAVRLILVLVMLLGQLPCGVTARASAAEPTTAAADDRPCRCCKRGKVPRDDRPAMPAPKPVPAKPTCPPDCPCMFCSPGFAPLTVPATPPQLVEPACDFLSDCFTSHVQAGHRPPLDRPPRSGY
jgi:hypothetical protein